MKEAANAPLMKTQCTECGHRHTTAAAAHICIGCPCEWRPSANVIAADALLRGEVELVDVKVEPTDPDGRTEYIFQFDPLSELSAARARRTHARIQASVNEVLGEFLQPSPGPFEDLVADPIRNTSTVERLLLHGAGTGAGSYALTHVVDGGRSYVARPCKHLSRYSCAGCNTICCMRCHQPIEGQELARELEIKTAVEWCQVCRGNGRYRMDTGLAPCDRDHAGRECADRSCWLRVREPRFYRFAYESARATTRGGRATCYGVASTTRALQSTPTEILHEAAEEPCECRGAICMKHCAIAELAIRRPLVVVIVAGQRESQTDWATHLVVEAMNGRIAIVPVELLDLEHTEAGAARVKAGDELLRRQVDLCDELLVLNAGGKVDRFAAVAVQHAEECGKVIRWLESPS